MCRAFTKTRAVNKQLLKLICNILNSMRICPFSCSTWTCQRRSPRTSITRTGTAIIKHLRRGEATTTSTTNQSRVIAKPAILKRKKLKKRFTQRE
uniref:Secreted protein n=1 Tax=Meloidogyne incognita TaxID=6306 RepID=A0A914MIH1_MELIC